VPYRTSDRLAILINALGGDNDRRAYAPLAKIDKVAEARNLLDRNGEAQSKAPGFVSRQTLYALTEPTKITTLVVWTSNDIYDAWRASPVRAAVMSGAEALWSKPPESERFEVAGP